jgi:hypothetical protein
MLLVNRPCPCRVCGRIEHIETRGLHPTLSCRWRRTPVAPRLCRFHGLAEKTHRTCHIWQMELVMSP